MIVAFRQGGIRIGKDSHDMRITGIVAEYNPFHKGHAWHIRQAREQTGADFIIVVLGGDFTQRGTPAILDKYTRARMALACGADLVLELPVRYACSSAEYFASGAVSILERLHCVDHLCFGSESGNVDALRETALLLDRAEADPLYGRTLQSSLKAGSSFPAARALALKTVCQKQAGLPDRPNDILGLEYCRALLRLHSPIRPSAVLRQGADYHDTGLHTGFSSASAIRDRINAGWHPDRLSDALPEEVLRIWRESSAGSCIMEERDFSAMLHYRLLLLTHTEEHSSRTGAHEPARLQDFADITPELADKIKNSLDSFTDWNAFCLLLKSRNYTHARISRCLAHILLDLFQEDLEESRRENYPVYLRMLGFSGQAGPLLSAIGKNAQLPLLSGLAQAGRRLPPPLLPLLSEEIRASHIYQAAVSRKYGTPFQNEYRRQIITPGVSS